MSFKQNGKINSGLFVLGEITARLCMHIVGVLYLQWSSRGSSGAERCLWQQGSFPQLGQPPTDIQQVYTYTFIAHVHYNNYGTCIKN